MQEERTNWGLLVQFRTYNSGELILLSAGNDPETSEKLHGHWGPAGPSQEGSWVDASM